MNSARMECPQVLVVDDDREIRSIFREVLEDEGYAVSQASNGAEALAWLRSNRQPCLVLLDLMMPVMDGWEFRAHQMLDASLAAIPVVLVSADGSAKQHASAMKAGDGLTKPVSMDKLLAAVQRYCRKAAS